MSLFVKRSPHEQIPHDAIELTTEEALRYEIKIIEGWENSSEV